ncbi:hypothetical protein PR202_gb21926 [Eleusine coracana subsp. coracana]|uniref:Elongation factor 1-beta n=1 Tax=Eleusine coracana subsp. coracana TaxID=191504 RepID=A0AAV5FEE0_ELECO|nr:hypothetical protein PR202_gb21926 [Eleusine coracana subsp. coracana]
MPHPTGVRLVRLCSITPPPPHINRRDSHQACSSRSLGFEILAATAAAPHALEKSQPSTDPMAVTFSDLHTADGLKALEAHLAGKTYVSGDVISKDDVKVFAAVPSKPGAEFPNAARWYETVSAALAARFPGKAAGVAGSSSAAPAPTAEAAKVCSLPLFFLQFSGLVDSTSSYVA